MLQFKWLATSLAASVALLCTSLNAQPYKLVYRIDTRPPAEVYASGVSTDGALLDLIEHALGGSCDADTPGERSAWVSTTVDPHHAIQVANAQLPGLRPLPSGVRRMWRYTIHTDSNFLSVTDVLQQARSAGSYGLAPYGPATVSAVTHLLERTRISTQNEVVALHRIPSANIESAITVTYDDSLPTGQRFWQGSSNIMNPHYRAPTAPMTNAVTNLPTLVPPATITLYGLDIPPNPELCALMCDGASNSNATRIRRSAVTGGLSCLAGPDRAQAFIGSEE